MLIKYMTGWSHKKVEIWPITMFDNYRFYLPRFGSVNFFLLEEWFSTGVPRHTRVPWSGPRGAAKYCIFLLIAGIYNDIHQ